MNDQPKDFKVGQVWKNRNDEHIRITKIHGSERLYRIEGHTGLRFTSSGRFFIKSKSPEDLVELVEDIPQPKVKHNSTDGLGKLLSELLDNPTVCDEFKADINSWFEIRPVGWILKNDERSFRKNIDNIHPAFKHLWQPLYSTKGE